MKYTNSDMLDGACTPKQYYGQFETAEIELGGVYVTNKGDWMETEFTIVYIGYGVALGIESVKGEVNKSKYSLNLSSPNRNLFYSEGIMQGWRVNDSRPSFRLQNK